MASFSLSFSLLSSSLPILPEGVVVGIQIFAGGEFELVISTAHTYGRDPSYQYKVDDIPSSVKVCLKNNFGKNCYNSNKFAKKSSDQELGKQHVQTKIQRLKGQRA